MTNQSQYVIDRIHESTAKKGKPGLARMRRLLEMLGNPERQLRIFHVAGTNGKGSISEYLKSMLIEAGYRVGSFTSPHVMEYNERFVVQREMISDDDFSRLGERVLAQNEALYTEGLGYLSEFEILNAIAYLYFVEQNAEYMISEVGIGGSMDCTNTIEDPVVSVIAQIGKDHVAVLGDTLREITLNKAGIIKEGIPVISESPEEEVRDVIRAEAARKNSEMVDTSEMPYTVRRTGKSVVFDAEILGTTYRELEVSMPGEHQVRNAIAAFAAMCKANERGDTAVSEEAMRRGLKAARVMGRFEILRENPTVIIDGAHNPNGIRAGMAAFRQYLKDMPEAQKLLIVFGCFKDKEYGEMADELAKAPAEAEFILTQPVSERALDCQELAETMQAKGRTCVAIHDEEKALEAALGGDYDVILFIGSIYLIGDIRIIFQTKGWIHNV